MTCLRFFYEQKKWIFSRKPDICNWQLAKANMVTSFSKVPVMMKYCLEIGVVSWLRPTLTTILCSKLSHLGNRTEVWWAWNPERHFAKVLLIGWLIACWNLCSYTYVEDSVKEAEIISERAFLLSCSCVSNPKIFIKYLRLTHTVRFQVFPQFLTLKVS